MHPIVVYIPSLRYTPFMTPEIRAILERSFHHSLRIEPKDLLGPDLWPTDLPIVEVGKIGSYDDFFQPLLEGLGFSTFQQLLKARKHMGLSTHTLDLFGSGLFFEDLAIPDTITCARFLDATGTMIQKLQGDLVEKPERAHIIEPQIERITRTIESPKWSCVEGNLFDPFTWWLGLDTDKTRRGIPAYDLIVAKPVGAFSDSGTFENKDWRVAKKEDAHLVNEIYALKFLRLLNRAYTRLSPQNGMIFTQVPDFIGRRNMLEPFKDTLAAGNVITAIQDWDYDEKHLLLIKQPTSVPDIEKLVRAAHTSK